MLDKIKRKASKALDEVNDVMANAIQYVLDNPGNVILVVGTAIVAVHSVNSKIDSGFKAFENKAVHVQIEPKDFIKVE